MTLADHLALAIDFSDPSKQALAATFELARRAGSKRVTVLHAARELELPHGGAEQLAQQLARVRRRVEDNALEEMRAMVAELGAPSIAVDYAVVHGRPQRVIAPRAVELGATLLVLGTHARSGLRRWIMGSVADECLQDAALPVLVTPPGHGSAAVTRVLVAADVSRTAGVVLSGGLQAARSIARGAAITLVTVTDLPAVMAPDADLAAVRDAVRATASERLEAAAEQLRAAGLQVDCRVEDGDAAVEIARVAAELGAELIVLGQTGRGRASRLGSTATELVCNAGAAVLVVPTPLEAQGA